MEANFLADIHPKVVHFPIALFTTYAFLEIIGILLNKEFIYKSALLILCIGVVTSFFAVLTGNQAATDFTLWNDKSTALLNNHQTYATYLLWFALFVCVTRIIFVLKKKMTSPIKYLFVLFALVLIFLVFQTGNYGGDLVKKFSVGIEVIKQDDSK
jgi:uncharacterized membrane protein